MDSIPYSIALMIRPQCLLQAGILLFLLQSLLSATGPAVGLVQKFQDLETTVEVLQGEVKQLQEENQSLRERLQQLEYPGWNDYNKVLAMSETNWIYQTRGYIDWRKFPWDPRWGVGTEGLNHEDWGIISIPVPEDLIEAGAREILLNVTLGTGSGWRVRELGRTPHRLQFTIFTKSDRAGQENRHRLRILAPIDPRASRWSWETVSAWLPITEDGFIFIHNSGPYFQPLGIQRDGTYGEALFVLTALGWR